jgi:hypothetical protein
MISKRFTIILISLILGGCSYEPQPVSEPPQVDPATAKPDYWFAKPAAATVYGDNYDQLWDAAAASAQQYWYDLDRQDYRNGILTTHPMVSKQFWEFWRHDAGDSYAEWQDTLQTVRRTVRFEFDHSGNGGTVSPKVLVERFAQPNNQITSTGEYRNYFSADTADANKTNDYWYPIGRDYALEAQLAHAIKLRINQ